MCDITDEEKQKVIEDICETAKPGDMLEFDRGQYNHWAIYIGGGYVIHRWNNDSDTEQSTSFLKSIMTNFGAQSDNGKIVKSKLFDVLKYGIKVRVNNYLDSERQPLDVQVILEKAERVVGQKGYDLICCNCEHFATECRYGVPISRQVRQLVWYSH
ncbi:unnamed protein product [Rotaria socialis]